MINGVAARLQLGQKTARSVAVEHKKHWLMYRAETECFQVIFSRQYRSREDDLEAFSLSPLHQPVLLVLYSFGVMLLALCKLSTE